VITIGKDLNTFYDGRPCGTAQCHHIREAMGLNPGKLPLGYVNAQIVGDTKVYVLSRETAEAKSPRSHRPHRMFAICNHCQAHIPTGRFGQHLKIHKGEESESAKAS
jgi:hypothetical protein